jgi:hypothetical protein
MQRIQSALDLRELVCPPRYGFAAISLVECSLPAISFHMVDSRICYGTHSVIVADGVAHYTATDVRTLVSEAYYRLTEAEIERLRSLALSFDDNVYVPDTHYSGSPWRGSPDEIRRFRRELDSIVAIDWFEYTRRDLECASRIESYMIVRE